MLGTDIRVASEKAVFALPEVSLGIVPAGGTLARLARQIPFVNAMELILTGEKISAEKALDMGLLNYVVKQEQVMDKAVEIARKFLVSQHLGGTDREGIRNSPAGNTFGTSL